MKSILLLFWTIFPWCYRIYSQPMNITFDVPYDYSLLFLKDTFRNVKPWEIGIPNKSIFKFENDHKRVIVTDTVNPIGKNDTFSTILKFTRTSGGASIFRLKFEYFLSGNNNDIAIIELSPDLGKNWVNLLSQDTTYDIFWNYKKPTFKGISNQWDSVYLDMSSWDNFNGFPIQLYLKDTVFFRFTYITDSTSGIRDGWMINNIHIEHGWSNISSIYNCNFNLYPNPTSTIVFINNSRNILVSKIEVYNPVGQQVLTKIGENITDFDISNLSEGIYSVRIQIEKQIYIHKLVIRR